MTLRAFLAPIALCLSFGAASASSLSTAYNSNNGQDGNMFDVLIGASDLTITSLAVNIDAQADMRLYLKTGSYVGSDTTASDWTLVDSISGLASAGVDNASLWDVADSNLEAGTRYGFYVTTIDGGMNYTNGTSVGDVAASNTDLTIFEGAGKAYAFGNTFEPRVWNGTINYTATSQIPVPAALPLSMAGLGALALMRRFRRA